MIANLADMSAGQLTTAIVSVAVIVLSVCAFLFAFFSGWRDLNPPRR